MLHQPVVIAAGSAVAGDSTSFSSEADCTERATQRQEDDRMEDMMNCADCRGTRRDERCVQNCGEERAMFLKLQFKNDMHG